jgi:Tfp pilus assembly protein PilN
MPSINMIAARRAEKRRTEKLTQRLIYGIVAEFGVFLIVSSCLAVRLVTTKSQSQHLDIRLQKLSPRVREIENLKNSASSLAPQITALSDAKYQIDSWRKALYDISMSLPKDMWLTSMISSGDFSTAQTASNSNGASADDQSPVLTLSGMAGSQFSVGAAMLQMDSRTSISKVTLADMSESSGSLSRSVTCHLVVSLKANKAQDVGGKGG